MMLVAKEKQWRVWKNQVEPRLKSDLGCKLNSQEKVKIELLWEKWGGMGKGHQSILIIELRELWNDFCSIKMGSWSRKNFGQDFKKRDNHLKDLVYILAITTKA